MRIVLDNSTSFVLYDFCSLKSDNQAIKYTMERFFATLALFYINELL